MKIRSIYVHSGRFTWVGVLRGLLVGLALGAILAAAYAYAILYIPLVGTVTFLLSLGFGFLVGTVTGLQMKAGDVRNSKVAASVALIVAGAAWYASWPIWVHAFLQRVDQESSLTQLFLDPRALWRVVVQIDQVGAWSIRGVTPTGFWLALFWVSEALLIVGVGAAAAVTATSEPYCEDCAQWSKHQRAVAQLGTDSEEGIQQRLRADSIAEAFQSLGPPSSEAWTLLDLHRCECEKLNTLDVSAWTKQKGRARRSGRARDVLITKAEANALRELGKSATGPS